MKITVFYIQKVETSSDQLDVKASNKTISDVASNFQNLYLIGLDNNYQSHLDEVEIELQYNSDNEIFWGFRNKVSEEIKEVIREWLKGKTKVIFHN